MGPISTSAVIDAPRDAVFDFLADLANRPVFLDHYLSEFRLTRIESRGIGAGARFRIDAPLARMWAETVVVASEAPSRLDERGRTGRGGRIPLAISYELREAGAGMTAVTAHVWTEPERPLDRLKESLGAQLWHRRAWRRGLGRLADALESPEQRRLGVRVAGRNPQPTGIP